MDVLERLDTDLEAIADYLASADRLLKQVAADPTLMTQWQWSRARTHLRIAASLIKKARDKAQPGTRGPADVRKRVGAAFDAFDAIETQLAALPPGRAKRDPAAAEAQLAATRTCVGLMLRAHGTTKRRARRPAKKTKY